ncbi:helix-turn-helix transcriptional regulator [Sediminicola luteus]|uniref:HTH araC/xylS-type domain-containing protein n=1 Tax=Sediminicola luteus TaxID=319238 RepID=A0A2A4GD11_9FLAO|nr:AraC family transcriptional regulator [Sediminicola luteus]PCE65856.1 hypothetical protein B7P33_00710 [Sediminicola luteus]
MALQDYYLTLKICPEFLDQVSREIALTIQSNLEEDFIKTRLKPSIVGIEPNLYHTFELIFDSQATGNSRFDFLWELKIKEFLFYLIQLEIDSNKEVGTASHTPIWLLEIDNYLHRNFTKNIPMQKLIRRSGLNESYFYQRFKSFFGTTPLSYITNLRIKKAQFDLYNTKKTIKQIAYDAGFNSLEHFYRKFKANTGATPLEFRRNPEFRRMGSPNLFLP